MKQLFCLQPVHPPSRLARNQDLRVREGTGSFRGDRIITTESVPQKVALSTK